MNLLSTVTPTKNVQYFTGLLYFSKFDKCDIKSHLRKVTGQFFNRPITVPRFLNFLFVRTRGLGAICHMLKTDAAY